MTMAAPPQIVLPFSYGSKLRYERIQLDTDFALDGAVVDVELDPVGYGYGLLVHVHGTWTVAVAPLVFKGAGIYDYLRRVVLDTPGQANPIDVSGDQLKLQNVFGRDIVMSAVTADEPGNPTGLFTNTWADANLKDVFANAVAGNPFHLWYWVPLTRNARDLRGLRSLGHAGQRSHLRLTPSTEADLVTVPANSDSSAVDVEVFQFFYDSVPAGVGGPPSGWVVTIEEASQLIQAVGDQEVDIDPEGIVLNLVSRVIINDAPDSADIESVSLNLDRRKLVDEVPYNLFAWYAQRAHRVQIPVGVVPFDRDQFAEDPEPIDPTLGNTFRGRDWIFSDELVKFFPTIGIDSAAVLGAVAKIVTSVRRLVPIAGR